MTTLLEHWNLLGTLAMRAKADMEQRDRELEGAAAEIREQRELIDRLQHLVKVDQERAVEQADASKRPQWTCGSCEARFHGYPAHVAPGPDGTPLCDRCAKADVSKRKHPRTDAERERVWCPRIGGLVDTCRHGYGNVCSEMCEEDRTTHIDRLFKLLAHEIQGSVRSGTDGERLAARIRAVLDRELPFSDSAAKGENPQ